MMKAETEKFRACLEKAGNVLTCSWTVGTVRENDSGKIIPVAIFYDSNGMEFSHAFSFNGNEALSRFCVALEAAGMAAAEKNSSPLGLVRP